MAREFQVTVSVQGREEPVDHEAARWGHLRQSRCFTNRCSLKKSF